MREMNPVEKWRKNQKDRQKKRNKDRDHRDKPAGQAGFEEPKREKQVVQRAPIIVKVDEVTPEIQAKRELYWEQQRRSLQEHQQKSHRLEDLDLRVKAQRPVEKCPFGIDRYPELFYECLRDIRSEEEALQQKIVTSLKHQFHQKLVAIEEGEQRAAEERLRLEEAQRLQTEAEERLREEEALEGLSCGDSGAQEDAGGSFLKKRAPPEREAVVPRDRSSHLISSEAVLKEDFLLRKQRPNFLPSSIRLKQKKLEQETADRREREELEREEREAQEREAILSRARKAPALHIPKPAGLLDADDDSSADN